MTILPPSHLMRVAIEPKSAEGRTALFDAIHVIADNDPTLDVCIDQESGQLLLWGMSELQIDLAIDRLERESGVAVNIGAPCVAYRERLGKWVDIDYTHDKLRAGTGEFARVRILCQPNDKDAGNGFDLALSAAELAEDYITSVRKGIESALAHGLQAGYPVVDVSSTLIDAAFHERDSSVMAFAIAARAATREALQKGECLLMEPIMRLEITSSVEYEGSLVGDMNSRRGKIIERTNDGETSTLIALAPLSNLFGYYFRLGKLTQGRGAHCMSFSHYADVPEKAPPNPDGTFPPAVGMRLSA